MSSLKRFGGGIWVSMPGSGTAEQVSLDDVTLLLGYDDDRPYPNVKQL